MEEIVLLIGNPAAGKTTAVEKFVNQGYARINRDEIGGRLLDLPQHVESAYRQGERQFILDNTYADVESRKGIIAKAGQLGLPIRCVYLDTTLEDAQYNACIRMFRKTGKILSPEEMKKTKDPNLFPPAALFGYRKRFQMPTVQEGFVSVEVLNFVRTDPVTHTNKALILDYDGTLRDSTGEYDYPIDPKEIKILPGRKEKLQNWKKQGWRLLGVSNQSGIAKGILTEAQARACFDRTNELLGVEIEYYFCPHKIPPVVCFCRKPSTGYAALLVEKYNLDRKQCVFVGDQTSDQTFAERAGFLYYTAENFFSS